MHSHYAIPLLKLRYALHCTMSVRPSVRPLISCLSVFLWSALSLPSLIAAWIASVKALRHFLSRALYKFLLCRVVFDKLLFTEELNDDNDDDDDDDDDDDVCVQRAWSAPSWLTHTERQLSTSRISSVSWAKCIRKETVDQYTDIKNSVTASQET